MTHPAADSLEAILHYCAAAAPDPWYPKIHAESNGVSRESLDLHLDRLRLGGIIRLTDWVQGKGQGYVLTPEGTRLLESPRDLERFKAGKLQVSTQPAVNRETRREGDSIHERHEEIRDVLVGASNPVVTKILFSMNILVYVLGMGLALQKGVSLKPFFEMWPSLGGGYGEILVETGAMYGPKLVAEEWQRGQWWRVVTCCFVHIGLLHIFVNMYSLFIIGPLVEKMWGHARFLMIYMAGGVVGSCAMLSVDHFASVFARPIVGAGASGAIWGLLTALAGWVLVNRNYLGPQLATAWMRRLLLVFLINGVISLAPGISMAGHLGGGAGGLAVALLLHYHRYGPPVLRWLGLAAALAVPVVCFAWIVQSIAHDPRWNVVLEQRNLFAGQRRPLTEEDRLQWLKDHGLPLTLAVDEEARHFFDEEAFFVIRPEAGNRNPQTVEEMIAQLSNRRTKLMEIAKQFEVIGKVSQDLPEKERQKAQQLVTEWANFFDEAGKYLSKGENSEEKLNRIRIKIDRLRRDLDRLLAG